MGVSLKAAGAVALLVAAAAVVAPSPRAEPAHACGAGGPFDFDTFEMEDYTHGYARAIEVAVEGKAVAGNITLPGGEVVDLRYQGLETGPRGQRTPANPALRIPPVLYKSIAWIEANWNQASSDVPYGGIGPVLRSFDCGYGLGQVTTGMANPGAPPLGKQALIGTHFLFNLAEGVRILADKWNQAPELRPVAGNGNPAFVEDWYYAIWSYNGFAFSNHPLNPNRDPLRGGGLGVSPVYHCEDDGAPSWQGRKFGYGDYTYPERVYGCMQYPPRVNGERLWAAQPLSMPAFTNEIVSRPFAPEYFTACENAGLAGGCPAMDFPTAYPPTPAKPGPPPVPELPGAVTHLDTTPSPGGAQAQAFVGGPKLGYKGPLQLSLDASASGVSTVVTFQLENQGTWLAPYRIRTSQPWLVVRHPKDDPERSLDGGVVVGKETDVVLQGRKETATALAVANEPELGPRDTTVRVGSTTGVVAGDIIAVDREDMLVTALDGTRGLIVTRGVGGTAAVKHTAGTPIYKVRPRVAQKGYASDLIVTLNAAAMPPGTHRATLVIEPLLGALASPGGVVQIAVTASKGEDPRPFRAVAPAVAAGR